ncbi:MAG: M67 family metallopeptidase [Candidatus Korobacteraceae bacterium]
MTLHITTADYEALRQHAEQAYPDECCGALLGKIVAGERHVHLIVPCQNTRVGELSKRYEIDPAELVRVQREARESGMEIVGFYHSHPDHPAQPSPTDLEHAHWIGYSYVIISVKRGQAAETRSFLLSGLQEEDKSFTEEDLSIGRLGPANDKLSADG